MSGGTDGYIFRAPKATARKRVAFAWMTDAELRACAALKKIPCPDDMKHADRLKVIRALNRKGYSHGNLYQYPEKISLVRSA
jgi:hypothetical protein